MLLLEDVMRSFGWFFLLVWIPAAAVWAVPGGTEEASAPVAALVTGSSEQATASASALPTQNASAPGAYGSSSPQASLSAEQVRALLYKIYMATYRVTDLLSVLQPAQLHLSDADLVAFNQRVSSLRADLNILEKSRSELYNDPDHLEAGEETTKMLSTALAEIRGFADDLARDGDAGDAALYRQAAADMARWQQDLERYVGALEARSAKLTPRSISRGPGLTTETVTVPANTPPLNYTTPPEGGAGYLKPADVKALLDKVYMAAYRASDLLTVLHPDRQKLSAIEYNNLVTDSEQVREALKELEPWRRQFAERPDSMYLAFQTYAALNVLGPGVGELGHAVTRLVDPNLGAQYGASSRELTDLERQLSAYVGYLVARQHQSVAALEDNLARCQSTLGYALMPRREPVIPMKNIVPQFKGRRARPHEPRSATPHGAGKKKSEPLAAKTTSGR
jgi:hypothetical protein